MLNNRGKLGKEEEIAVKPLVRSPVVGASGFSVFKTLFLLLLQCCE